METIRVNLGERSYDIEIEAGCLGRLGPFVRNIPGMKAARAAVVTTNTVAGLYLDMALSSLGQAGFDTTPVIIPDGEEFKTVATWESILSRLIEARFERSSVVVALGGGVVGDMAGFAAAALLRGVPFVQVPTTIVSQVDSSIGGKVAVNHPLGKNLIGSFHQPRGVLIDTRTLATLPPKEVVSGLGEALKHAVIRDEAFFAFLEEHIGSIMSLGAPDDVMERFIAWNCRIKAEVVAADEREGGIRAILNYGHTIGHALETATGYTRFSHGEAVMLGMVAAGGIARSMGMFSETDLNRQNALIARTGPSWDTDGIDPETLFDIMTRDKKVSAGRIRFVLPSRIGWADVYGDVGTDAIRGGIDFLLRVSECMRKRELP